MQSSVLTAKLLLFWGLFVFFSLALKCMLYPVLKGIPILPSLHWMQPANVQPSTRSSFCARAINYNAELNGNQDLGSLGSFISDPSAANHPSATMVLFLSLKSMSTLPALHWSCAPQVNTDDCGAWLHVTVCPFSALGLLGFSRHLRDLVFIHIYF